MNQCPTCSTDVVGETQRAKIKENTMEYFGIGKAIDELLDGKKVARYGWNATNQYIELKRPSTISDMTLAYIFIKTVQGDRIPWLASQSDILGVDWFIFE